ncbi:peptide ligase PGM1-related protein [Kitasatospora xanthocidica]|uniref:peptide ligase PGM1-related protein n=1 Tax=Kitasatospora xanthocidica TaxID=83382 RepID=UPI0036E2FCE9
MGCQINLRGTGTRHAFGIASAVLGTRATPDGRLLVAGPGSSERVYECSDSLIDPRYAGLRPTRLIRAVTGSPLGYDPERATGVVLHTLSAVTYHGKFGAVCIGADQADRGAPARAAGTGGRSRGSGALRREAPDRWDGTP